MKELQTRGASRMLGIFAMPAICFILMTALTAFGGATLFVGGTGGNITGFFKNICYFTLLCFAVSINLHTGRMGFDIGAIIVLSAVLGFIAGITAGDSVPVAFLVSVLSAVAFSIISGALYVALRLPMMIVSLGTTLIYEAFAYWIVRSYAYEGNVETLQLKRALTPGLSGISSDIRVMVVLTAVATLIMVFVFHFTRFGYNYRALASGQRISVSTGIREIRNAMGCYVVQGLLLGLAGIINYSYVSAVKPSINFGTVPIMFECFCPLFFGTFLMKYTNKQLGILIGVISYSVIQTGLGQLRIVLDWNNYVIPLINAAILVVFMIYQTNEGAMKEKFRSVFRRREEAAEDKV